MAIDRERAVFCGMCRLGIPPGEAVYTLRIDLFHEAGRLEIDDEDIAAAHGGAWERLLDEMESMTGDQVEDEIAKVHERHEFTLCAPCREKFHALLAELKKS